MVRLMTASALARHLGTSASVIGQRLARGAAVPFDLGTYGVPPIEGMPRVYDAEDPINAAPVVRRGSTPGADE